MRRADQRVGWRAFSLTYRRKGIFTPVDDLDLKEPRTMRMTMFKFAEFCAGSDSDRDRIIGRRLSERRRREQQRDKGEASRGGGGGYYTGLVKVLREQHWKTNDIEQLDEAGFDLDTSKRGGEKKLKAYQCLKGKYVDTWRVQDASYFDVNSAGLRVGELSIMVDPVVGMRTSTADRALQLRFPAVEMEPAVLNVCDYLLWEGGSLCRLAPNLEARHMGCLPL